MKLGPFILAYLNMTPNSYLLPKMFCTSYILFTTIIPHRRPVINRVHKYYTCSSMRFVVDCVSMNGRGLVGLDAV